MVYFVAECFDRIDMNDSAPLFLNISQLASKKILKYSVALLHNSEVVIVYELLEKIRWDFINYTSHSRIVYANSPEIHTLLQETLHLQGNENILDVGCGMGTLVKNLSSLITTGTITGIDLNHNLVEYGNCHWAAFPHTCLKVGDAYALPFPDNTFDVVLSMGLIENISNSKRALTEMIRVLKAHGKLVILQIDVLKYTETPQEPSFQRFYRDLIQGMAYIGVDLQMARFRAACEQLELDFKTSLTNLSYQAQISEEFIRMMTNGMQRMFGDPKIFEEAVGFNYQYLQHVGWSSDMVVDFIDQLASSSIQEHFLRPYLGKNYIRNSPIHLYYII